MTPPLRFLALALGGWVLARAAVLAYGEGAPPAGGAGLRADAPCLDRHCERSEAIPLRKHAGALFATGLPRRSAPRNEGRGEPPHSSPSPPPSLEAQRSNLPPEPNRRPRLSGAAAPAPAALAHLHRTLPPPPRPPDAAAAAPHPPLPAALLRSRWSVSAWVSARPGDGRATPGLAPGGMLGGSQAGVRALYRLAPGLAAAARLSSPRRIAGAEAALGVEWQPDRRLPLRLLAERRQALGGEGRSAFALLAHGGVSDAPLGRFRLDAYAQAGAIGLRRRDLFADGAARLTLPLEERVSIGAGAFAAAQPGAARLDLGPTLTLRLPEARLRATLDWRLRAAGNARPGSGPALTLAADF